jgi:hypothetical protein
MLMGDAGGYGFEHEKSTTSEVRIVNKRFRAESDDDL